MILTRRKKYILLFTFLLIMPAGIAYYSYCQPFYLFKTTPQNLLFPLPVGVVDINTIKTESKIFQRFKEAFDARNAIIHQEILEKETKLRAEFEEYEHLKKQEEETQEPNEQLVKRKSQLDKKVAELETLFQSRKEELYEKYTKSLNKIKQALKDIMNSLSQTHGLKIILNKSLGEGYQMDQSIVLFCNEGIDMTQRVIQELDKQTILNDMEK